MSGGEWRSPHGLWWRHRRVRHGTAVERRRGRETFWPMAQVTGRVLRRRRVRWRTSRGGEQDVGAAWRHIAEGGGREARRRGGAVEPWRRLAARCWGSDGRGV